MVTDERLAEIERRLTDQDLPIVGYVETAELIAEIRRLREQIAGHADRIAKQSELLSRRAEKPLSWTSEPPKVPGWYFHRTGPNAVDPPICREVTQSGGGLVIWSMDGEPDTLTGWGGEWAGPILPPNA